MLRLNRRTASGTNVFLLQIVEQLMLRRHLPEGSYSKEELKMCEGFLRMILAFWTIWICSNKAMLLSSLPITFEHVLTTVLRRFLFWIFKDFKENFHQGRVGTWKPVGLVQSSHFRGSLELWQPKSSLGSIWRSWRKSFLGPYWPRGHLNQLTGIRRPV